MRINKVVETCIYSSDLDSMKRFYVDTLGIPLVQEEKGKLIFLQAGKSMLLIFNPERTSVDNDGLPTHGAAPPSRIHFALEVPDCDYPGWKELLVKKNIRIEKEVEWKGRARSLYLRDPAGNLVELITPGEWPVER
jgi:catechol 2,3-dioxygenase-like lactoylglutathione lyase family enzyme